MIRFEMIEERKTRPILKKVFKKNKTLASKKLSTIAAAAFKDYKLAKATPGVRINMGEWFQPFREWTENFWDRTVGVFRNVKKKQTCEVCLAGSVLLAHGLPPGAQVQAGWDADKSGLMSAVNDLREGDIIGAARSLGRSVKFRQRLVKAGIDEISFPCSRTSGTPSWERGFQKMIRTLRRKGF